MLFTLFFGGGLAGLAVWKSRPAENRSVTVNELPRGEEEPITRTADQADIILTPAHELKSVRHKDAGGLSPQEIVQTAAGPVTIQRTFDRAGMLLKEEAFLNGERIPLPVTDSH